MNNKLVASLLVAGIMLFATVGLAVIYGVGLYNKQASMQNLYDAKLKANNADFDNMWKVISQNYQVTEKNKEGLKEIFNSYAQARSSGSDNDNLIMKWVQESVPNVDLSIYRTLANTITGSRNDWTMRQKELVDIARQYNEPLTQVPSKWILGLFGFSKIDAKVITSSRTEEAFRTGQDNDTILK